MTLKKVSLLFAYLFCFILWTLEAQAQTEKENSIPSLARSRTFAEANEIAEKFVARWHETLDLRALQDEFYTKDRMLWQAILGGEIGWDLQGIESCNSKTFAQNNYLLIQQAAFSIATFQALTEEYDVYYYGTSSEVRVYPDDLASISVRIQELFDVEESGLKRFANDTSIRGAKIDCDDKLQQFLTKLIAEVEAASGLFRQQLSMNLFQDAQYKKNLEGLVKAGTLEEPPDLSDYPDLYEILRFNNPSAQIIEAGSVETNGTKKDLIEVRKGIFNLVFVQEGAQLKILFAMPTRIVD